MGSSRGTSRTLRPKVRRDDLALDMSSVARRRRLTSSFGPSGADTAKLCEQDRKDELATLYGLLKRVDKLGVLRAAFLAYLKVREPSCSPSLAPFPSLSSSPRRHPLRLESSYHFELAPARAPRLPGSPPCSRTDPLSLFLLPLAPSSTSPPRSPPCLDLSLHVFYCTPPEPAPADDRPRARVRPRAGRPHGRAPHRAAARRARARRGPVRAQRGRVRQGRQQRVRERRQHAAEQAGRDDGCVRLALFGRFSTSTVID